MNLTGIMAGPSQAAISISPAMHNAAFRALEMDWLYVRLPVKRVDRAFVRALALAGFRGWNVTMPHKTTIAEVLDELDASATSIGAVNTIEVLEGKAIGRNTDARGLLRFLRTKDIELQGINALVLGAGGGARAAVSALVSGGVRGIRVLARDPHKAERLLEIAGGAEFQAGAFDFVSALPLAECELLVNATPLGQQGQDEQDKTERAPQFRLDAMPRGGVVVDLVYHPSPTGLVDAASRLGLRAFDGLGMLVHQAALSFEIWTKKQAPLEVMEAAALAELGKPNPPSQEPA